MKENLNIWDRFFNRYRRVVLERGVESWSKRDSLGRVVENSDFSRHFVLYKKIDRLTGSETVEKIFFN